MPHVAERLKRAVPVLAAVATAAALSGCGVASTQFHPGVAAQVGDQTITTKHVDSLTSDYCSYAEKNASGGSDPVPLHYLSSQVVQALVLRAAAQELGDRDGVEPTSAYRQEVAQAEAGVADGTSSAQRDALVELQSATAYTRDVLTTLGGQELEAQGTSGASAQDQLDQGLSALTDYLGGDHVEVNPKYSLDLSSISDSSGADPSISDTSVAVSSLATGGQAADPDAAYAAQLPGDLVCGE